MNETSKEVTREALHGLVWQTPMSRLAEQFGISGNGLAKICRRLDVPYPPRGWWAKKAAGKALKIEPLPAARADTPLSAAISVTPEQGGELKSAIRQRQQELGDIAVPERLLRPHALIAGWIDDRRRRMEQAKRERDPWRRSHFAVADFTSSDRRRHRILHALFHALEQHGATVAETDRRQIVVTILGEEMEFSLQEKSRQVTRPMTEKEKQWETWNKSGVKTELEPTGLLQFSIKAWTDQPIRKNWMESEKRPLDGMLSEIAATFLVLAPLLAERTRVRQEESRRFAERQREIELEEQRRRKDANRWKRFLEIAEGWERAELARSFIRKLREQDIAASEPVDGRALAEWLDWAEERVKFYDPVEQGIDRIFSDVAQVQSWTYPR